MATAARLLFGPQHPLWRTLRSAETDAIAFAEAQRLVEALPALYRRRLLSGRTPAPAERLQVKWAYLNFEMQALGYTQDETDDLPDEEVWRIVGEGIAAPGADAGTKPQPLPTRELFHYEPGGDKSNKACGADTVSALKPSKLLQTLSEFLAALQQPDYVVDGLFIRGYLYCLTAMTGAGKTAIALLLAEIVSNHVMSGKFGPYEVQYGRVVYIACENAEDVRRRLVGMEAKMEFSRNDLDMLVIDKVIDLEKNLARIRKEVDEFGSNIALVIIDTSAAMFQGDDENTNPQMLKHAKLQRQLCELPGNPCVLSLVHPTKHVNSPNELLPRGGGAYLDEVDGNFTAWGCGERLTKFHWTGKLRGPDFEPIIFRLPTIYPTNLKDKKGRLIPTVMAEVATNEQLMEADEKNEWQEKRLLAAMAKRPSGSLAEWARDCEWLASAVPGEQPQPNKSLVQRVLGRLVNDGYVKNTGKKYTLTKTGKEATKKPTDSPDESPAGG
jgi:hypothetical protein